MRSLSLPNITIILTNENEKSRLLSPYESAPDHRKEVAEEPLRDISYVDIFPFSPVKKVSLP